MSDTKQEKEKEKQDESFGTATSESSSESDEITTRPRGRPLQEKVGWKPGLKKTGGRHKRSAVVFCRKALKVELGRDPSLQDAVDQKLVTSPPPQTSPRPTAPNRPQLVRQKRGGVDLRTTLLQGRRDEIVAEFKAVRLEIDKAAKLSVTKLGEQGVNDLVKQLNERLGAAIKTANEFLSDTQKESGLPNVKPLRNEVSAEMAETKRAAFLIEGIDAGFTTDLVANTSKRCDDLGSAIALKKCGIRNEDLKLDSYGDDKLDRSQCDEKFGAGAVNSVSKLVYGNEVRIFKPEPTETDSAANLIANFGIDKKNPRFGNRNIATSEVSKLLGGSVIPEACFTSHDGKLGLLMQAAPGTTMEDLKAKGFNPNPPAEDDVASLHGQLSELEWTDMLTGQGDRHDKNYLVDATPGKMKITGIDNDFCFGNKQDTYGSYGADVTKPWTRFYGYTSAHKPTLIDKKIYDKIMAMDFDKDVAPKLKGLLHDDEVQASKTRIAEMQDLAKSLAPDFVVDNWKTWRSPKTTEHPDGQTATEFLKASKSTNLFQRDFGKLLK